MSEQARKLGAPSDVVDRLRAQESEGATFEIHEDNQDTVGVFMALQTQWRVLVGMGVAYQGLDYGAIPAVFSLLDIKRLDQPRIFHELRAMEFAALPLLNEKKTDAE